MYSPESFVKHKDLPNIDRLIRKDLTTGNITINGIIFKTNGYIIGVPREILFNYGQVNYTTAGLKDLHSTSIPLNTLNGNGDCVDIRSAGSFATNDNDKRLLFSYDGTTLLDTSLLDIDVFGWDADTHIGRIDSTHVTISIVLRYGQILTNSTPGLLGTSPGGLLVRHNFNLAVSNLNANNTVFLVRAEASANNDVTQDVTRVWATQLS